MTRPLVSVCIPTRDRARWLSEALRSVFRQTLQDFEVIVYDDASVDDTRQVVAGWRDRRLTYLRHPRPVGVARNRNACLAAARGRYIAWLDSDDRYHRDMLAVQYAALERHPQAVMAHAAFEVIDESGGRLPDWPRPFERDVVESGSEAFGELSLKNYVGAPTVVVRRWAHRQAGPYTTSLPSGEDWEMWLRLALLGDLAYTARPLAQYRWHPESLTRQAESSGSRLRRDLQVISGVFARHRASIPQADVLESRARAAQAARALRQATDCMTRHQRRATLSSLVAAVRARPALWRKSATWRLLGAAARGREYAWHVASKALFAGLAGELAGTRLGEGLRRAAMPASEWEETLREIARTVRHVVPRSAGIAVVDKWDPTLLHLSERRGWHFPDRRTLPDGYPTTSAAAVSHLEDLRCRGARYLVFPSARFWWFDHYPGLVRHLELSGERIWQDERCVIYRLLAPESRGLRLPLPREAAAENLEQPCEVESS